MATQAYKGKIVCDGYDISNLARSAQVDFTMDTLDTTTFDSDGWSEGIPGIKAAGVTMDILRKGELAAHEHLLDSVFGDGIYNNIVYMPEGGAVGQDAYMFVSYQTGHNLGAPVNGVVGGEATFTTNGPMNLGTVLMSHVGTTPFTGDL